MIGAKSCSNGVRAIRRPLDKATRDGVRLAITSSSAYDDNDLVNLAEVGPRLLNLSPDLHPKKNYGFARLRHFVEASGIVELKMKTREPAPPIDLVRLTN
ncbi:hypothetical protein Q7P37_001368 [Cladosporium fusiforme]